MFLFIQKIIHKKKIFKFIIIMLHFFYKEIHIFRSDEKISIKVIYTYLLYFFFEILLKHIQIV